MTISSRDKRALIGLGVAALLTAIYMLTSSSPEVVTVTAPSTPEMAEKRLARARQLAAIAPNRDEIMKQVLRDLAEREKGLIQAETSAQAQAQLLQIMRRLLKAQAPPLELKSVEMGQARPYGEDYGEVSVAVLFDCRVEQLVNLLADISAQPELIATGELRIGQAAAKEKIMPIRLMVTGLVDRRLAPQRKGLAAF